MFAGEADDRGVMRKGDVAIVGLSSSGRGRGSGFVVGLAVVLGDGVVLITPSLFRVWIAIMAYSFSICFTFVGAVSCS